MVRIGKTALAKLQKPVFTKRQKPQEQEHWQEMLKFVICHKIAHHPSMVKGNV
jgi:hypothetical protein